ncbi:MAG: tetratricopeptide repeat protein [bacterium]
MSIRSTVARAVALVLGLGLATAACGQYSISNIRALKAFKEGNELYGRKEYKSAAEHYQEAFDRNPEFRGIGYFFLGNSYDNLYKDSKKGDPQNDAYLQKAIDNYKLAIDKIKDTDAPTAPDIRKRSYEFLIAAYKDKMKDFAQAEPVAKQMIDMDPTDPTNYQVLGALYEDAGRYDDAEAMFLKSTQVKATDPQVYSALAGYYNRQGQFEKTMAALQKRADAEPNNPEAWHTMATYYSEKAIRETSLSKSKVLEYAQAGIAADDKALAINPTYAEAMVFKNILLLVQARLEPNPAKRAELTKQADALKAKAIELQKQQAQGAAAAKKGGDK